MSTTGLSAFLAQSERLPGRIRPLVTYRPWNMNGNTLISSIRNAYRTIPVHSLPPPICQWGWVDSDACHF